MAEKQLHETDLLWLTGDPATVHIIRSSQTSSLTLIITSHYLRSVLYGTHPFKLPSELIPNRTAKFIAKLLQASDGV